jgi:hypothetical protein
VALSGWGAQLQRDETEGARTKLTEQLVRHTKSRRQASAAVNVADGHPGTLAAEDVDVPAALLIEGAAHRALAT